MIKMARPLAISLVLCAMTVPASAVSIPAPAAAPDASLVPVKDLLCGSGWHYSFYYFKCIRNRHQCPAGKHWISLLKVCV